MKTLYNPDPLGEYFRLCPYCKDAFIANHLSRKFCPEKNGVADYCKNRFKRKKSSELKERLEDRLIHSNASVLRKVCKGNYITYVHENELLSLKYRFDIYLCKTPVYRDDFYSVLIDDYCVERIRQDSEGATFKIRRLV